MTSVGITPPVPAADERRYRAGRGGYDPENAAQLARAKYVFRQRMVLSLVVGSLVTIVLAFTMSGLLWWPHAALDVGIVGYLVYLRRQVRIEDEVRQRRAARHSGSRVRSGAPEPLSEAAAASEEAVSQPQGRSAVEAPPPHARAVAVDSDDGDPIFEELRPTFEPRYRRAVG